MALNHVAPSQQRKLNDQDVFKEFYNPPRYREAELDLFARGVVPIRFCEKFNTTAEVRVHLVKQGFYDPVHLSGSTYWDSMNDKEKEAYEVKFKGWVKDYNVLAGT